MFCFVVAAIVNMTAVTAGKAKRLLMDSFLIGNFLSGIPVFKFLSSLVYHVHNRIFLSSVF